MKTTTKKKTLNKKTDTKPKRDYSLQQQYKENMERLFRKWYPYEFITEELDNEIFYWLCRNRRKILDLESEIGVCNRALNRWLSGDDPSDGDSLLQKRINIKRKPLKEKLLFNESGKETKEITELLLMDFLIERNSKK